MQKFWKKYQRIISFLAIILFLYFMFVGFLTGFYTKRQIIHSFQDRTGMTLKIGLTYVYPFSGKGVLKNIRIENPEGYVARNALIIREIRFKGSYKTFYYEPMQIKTLEVHGIEINFEPKSDSNNFQQIYERSRQRYAPGSMERFKKVQIETLTIDEILISAGIRIIGKIPYEIRLPEVVMENVGYENNGIRFPRLGESLLYEYMLSLEKFIFDPTNDVSPGFRNAISEWIEKGKVWLKR